MRDDQVRQAVLTVLAESDDVTPSMLATGLSKSTLWKIEHGTVSPSLSTAVRLERWIIDSRDGAA
jgi:predicted transcriptional regulator